MRIVATSTKVPVTINVTEDHDGTCHIIITSPIAFTHELQLAISLLQQVGKAVEKHQQAMDRLAYAHRLNSEHRQHQMMVQKVYLEYRACGLRHRAAIRATIIDQRCSELKWAPADIAWCAKADFSIEGGC